MPLYTYKAKNDKGKIVEDTIQATNKVEAASFIKSEGLQVLTVKDVDSKLKSFFGGRISVSQKAEFSRFLATMLRSGLPLPEALDNIREEAGSRRLREILAYASFQTRKGSSLSNALSKYPKDFDPVFLTMIRAGEQSGTLEKSFDYLANQLLSTHEMMQKVKGSLMYPSVIVVAMIGNGIVMVTFVLPKISEVFYKLDLELPALTRAVFAFGAFAGEHTFLVLGVIFSVLISVFLFIYVRSTRKIVISLLAKLPAVKKVLDQIDMSRFARTLSTLLRSGVPVMEALDVSSDALTQPKMKTQAKKFSEGVSRGESLTDVLVKGKKVFPLVLIQTVKAGEKTGSLEKVLLELAEFYEKEVDYSLKRLTSLLEPVLMIVIGVAVGAMVIMMITPIYNIVGGLEGL